MDRIHQAGADFALSISQIANRLLTRRLLGRDSVSVDARLEVLEAKAHGLAGRSPRELDVRERTGCSLIAIGRGSEVLVELGEDLRIEAGDSLFFCGGSEALRQLRKDLGLDRAAT